MHFFTALLITFLTMVSQSALAEKTWYQRLSGTKPDINTVEVGSTLYHLKGVMYDHVEKGKDWWFRPSFSISYQGWSYFYFKNTHRQDTIGIGIERNWYNKQKALHRFITGYRAGAIYGYCIKREPKIDFYSECDKNFQAAIHPMVQAFVNYSYDRMGFEIGINPGFLNAAFLIRF